MAIEIQLNQFEGGLDLLLQLVSRGEFPAAECSLAQLVARYGILVENSIEEGAEFLGLVARLLAIKSRSLLPSLDQNELEEEEELFSRREIADLIAYCEIRELAKALWQRSEECEKRHGRPILPIEAGTPPLGIEEISLAELRLLFEKALSKARTEGMREIREEGWRVEEKILLIEKWLSNRATLPIEEIVQGSTRGEVIALFLALLELMKRGSLELVRIEGRLFTKRHER